MIRSVSVLVLVLSLCALALGQEATKEIASKDAPKTRFEAFATADGVLKIKEVFELSSLKNKYGTAESKLVRVTNARSAESVIALVLKYKGSERFDREVVETLDEDEITSLDAALEYMRTNRQKLIDGATTYTEVTYRSRGGFSAGFYIKSKQAVDYISVGHESVFLDSISELERVVSEAKAKIAEIGKKK
jgi:phosphopentomutase